MESTAMTTTGNLEAFEQTLPPVTQPIASYVTAVQAGDLVFTSGALPIQEGVVRYTGAVDGSPTSLKQGREAARLCCINLLSVLKDKLTRLGRIERIVKLTGYVNSHPDFTEIPLIINGASDLLVELLGEKGRHARTSVGVSALPLNATVEIDLVVQVTS